MQTIKYHAMTNKDYVAFSAESPIKGWFKPSDALGTCVLDKSETIKPLAEAKAYIEQAVARGDKVVRGKDVSQAGAAELMRAFKQQIARKTW